MSNIAGVLHQIRSVLDGKARVQANMGPFRCTIKDKKSPEEIFEEIMDLAGVKNQKTRDDVRLQMITILRQYLAEKTERMNYNRFDDHVLTIVMVDLTIKKNENGTVEVIGYYGALEADFSKEWLWREWKLKKISETFSIAYDQSKSF